jgi:hypothetical protein
VKYDAQMPINTSIRKRSSFLLFPMEINGEGRWMEHAEWYEECCHYTWQNGERGYKWKPVCWADDIKGPRSFLVERTLEEKRIS